jgi:hypothetical protein
MAFTVSTMISFPEAEKYSVPGTVLGIRQISGGARHQFPSCPPQKSHKTFSLQHILLLKGEITMNIIEVKAT